MKYDGCEVVRTAKQNYSTVGVYDCVVDKSGAVLLEKYVGDAHAATLTPESIAALKETSGKHFRLVGQLSVEPLTEAKVDEREPG